MKLRDNASVYTVKATASEISAAADSFQTACEEEAYDEAGDYLEELKQHIAAIEALFDPKDS